MILTKPKPGWHWVTCDTCGKEYAKVTHYGGKKELKACKHCGDIYKECYQCFTRRDLTASSTSVSKE